jgi:3-oxoacyl-(acyl-carrier-protein) synthase III
MSDMIGVRILGTASLTPGRQVRTDELAREAGRDPAEMLRKTGIETRYWTEFGTLAAPLGAEVLRSALKEAGIVPSELRRLIFVTTGSNDLMFPATGNQVAAALGLRGSCDTFDLNNACMGFLTAFDLAARSVATGLGPVAVVSVELNSRCIDKEEPRPYFIFGDAAAAVVLGPGRAGEGILSTFLANDGTLPTDGLMQHPQLTGRRERGRFTRSNHDITRIATETLLAAVQGAMKEAEVSLAGVEWVLPHQPNGAMFKLMCEVLGVEPARTVPVVQEVGNVSSAAIPLSLDRLLRTRPVQPGHRILMVGVGIGVSYGATLYRVGG